MSELFQAILPELILAIAAGVLFLMGISRRVGLRHAAAFVAAAALVAVVLVQIPRLAWDRELIDSFSAVRVFHFAQFVKLLTAAVGLLLLLLAWPTKRDGTGNAALDFSTDGPEFLGLMLLSLTGVMLVASANDMILLFLGIELASIPTYVMVSISRPLPVAQEAGVKYFFLGAMSAALMLFGFSYLYGTTGTLRLDEIMASLAPQAPALSAWQMLAVLMIVAGLAFKMAAVPLHVYAADVYQGAATPVTAFLSFTPKTSGFVALVKVLFVISAGRWVTAEVVHKLLVIIAILTMSVGNVLGLMQYNVKRLLAYSSIAHSGYMLVGLAALTSAGVAEALRIDALSAVLFYLAAYGIMNVGAFAVLILLPSRQKAPATSAETFDDLAGMGRQYPGLGLAMAVCCFSLIGLPLTVGFLGKIFLIKPALDARLYTLVIFTVLNAAVSAGYYLRIVAAMFLRTSPEGQAAACEPTCRKTVPLMVAVFLSAGLTILLGIVPRAAGLLSDTARQATVISAGEGK